MLRLPGMPAAGKNMAAATGPIRRRRRLPTVRVDWLRPGEDAEPERLYSDHDNGIKRDASFRMGLSMSANRNEYRFEQVERAIANLGEDLRIEVQMRREEIAHEREMRQQLARDHYSLRDEFNEQHRILLTAQVIMAEEMKQSRKEMKQLRAHHKEVDEKFTILIQMMDNFIREKRNGGAGQEPQ